MLTYHYIRLSYNIPTHTSISTFTQLINQTTYPKCLPTTTSDSHIIFPHTHLYINTLNNIYKILTRLLQVPHSKKNDIPNKLRPIQVPHSKKRYPE